MTTPPQRTPSQRAPSQRDAFIRELAEFLVEGQAEKSIKLEIERRMKTRGPYTAWADLRLASNVRGYATVEEAIDSLRTLLRDPGVRS